VTDSNRWASTIPNAFSVAFNEVWFVFVLKGGENYPRGRIGGYCVAGSKCINSDYPSISPKRRMPRNAKPTSQIEAEPAMKDFQ
jgi:hypothetical protein